MIYIAYNHDGYVVSIVNARYKELAVAYWQGASIDYDMIKNIEKDFINLDDHSTGVYPILKTKTVEKGIGMDSHKTIQVVR